MAPDTNGSNPTTPEVEGRPGPQCALRWGLAGLAIAAGLILAAPRPAPAEAGAAPACAFLDSAELAARLPPWHPPVGRPLAEGRALGGLPPWHPPMAGHPGRAQLGARPLAPVFDAPDTVDL